MYRRTLNEKKLHRKKNRSWKNTYSTHKNSKAMRSFSVSAVVLIMGNGKSTSRYKVKENTFLKSTECDKFLSEKIVGTRSSSYLIELYRSWNAKISHRAIN